MSKTLSITLRDDGTVYRDHDDKHIATVEDGNVKWKHHTFKNKHAAEVADLLDGDVPDEPEETETAVSAQAEADELDHKGRPLTPKALFSEGEQAGWYGEENPPVVEWRRKNWSKEQFADRYGNETALLEEIYEKEGLTYEA